MHINTNHITSHATKSSYILGVFPLLNSIMTTSVFVRGFPITAPNKMKSIEEFKRLTKDGMAIKINQLA